MTLQMARLKPSTSSTPQVTVETDLQPLRVFQPKPKIKVAPTFFIRAGRRGKESLVRLEKALLPLAVVIYALLSIVFWSV